MTKMLAERAAYAQQKYLTRFSFVLFGRLTGGGAAADVSSTCAQNRVTSPVSLHNDIVIEVGWV